jgi:CHAT domain-containing protein
MIPDKIPCDFQETLNELLQSSGQLDGQRRIELCRKALGMLSRKDNAALWALLQFELGNGLDQNPLGNRAENVEEAISAYRAALAVLTREAYPEAWAGIQNNLGNTLKRRIRGVAAENFEEAISCFKAALSISDFGSEKWGTTQLSLADAYNNRIRGTKQENIQEAISCSEAVIKTLTRQASPLQWAKAQVTLGKSYLQRTGLNRPETIERAISCFQTAMDVFSAGFPDWAAIQVALAVAYKDRLLGDPMENRQQAISFCKYALNIYTRETDPEKWAKLRHLLGTIYAERVMWGDEGANTQEALRNYQAAQEVFTRESFPENWAELQKFLGRLYMLPTSGNRSENIECAISCFSGALDVFIRDTFPSDWAVMQTGLGDAYAERLRGDRSKNVECAIICYKSAEEVFTREAFPEIWAIIQFGLAKAYAVSSQGEERSNSERAIEHYLLALETYESVQLWPSQHQLGIALGNAASALGQWEMAYRGYNSAITAYEALQREAAGQASTQELVAANEKAAWGAVFAAQVTGRFESMLEHIERAKSRHFLKLLGERGFAYSWPSQLPKDWHIEELLLGERLRSLGRYLTQADDGDKTSILQELDHTRSKISALQDRIETLAPDYAALRSGRTPTYAEMIHFLCDQPTGTVLLEFYDLPDKVIVTGTQAGDARLVVLTISLSQERLIEFLQSHLQEIGSGPSPGRSSPPVSWLQLSNQLLPDDLSELLERAQRVIIVPSGLLYELPLHTLLWKGEPLVAHFPVTYAPSLAVAMRAPSRKPPGQLIPMAAFGYVQESRLKPLFEGEATAVADIFGVKATVGEDATPQAVAETARKTRILHLSSHGFFNLDEPMQSGLVLAKGVVTAAAVMNWQIPGSLVNLSACLTARNRNSGGDELYGLMRAFLYAGASSIVSCMWSVDAKTTLNLMSLFYTYVKQGKDPASALRTATLRIRQDKPHPYYWAPFILVGDGGVFPL